MGSISELSIIKGPRHKLTPCSLYKLFENNLLKHSCKPATIYNDRTLTFQEVNERSNQYARVLLRESLQRSLKPSQDGPYIIVVCMEPSDNLLIVLLATWKAGAAYIAIDPVLTENRIRHIINESRPVMVICDNDVDRKLFGSSYTLNLNELNHKAVEMNANNIPDTQIFNNTEDLAIILYTSGSTGVPKGVKLPHTVLLNRFKWQWSTFPFTSDELVGVFKTSLSFVDSVAEIWSPLLYGVAVLVVPKATTKDPEKLVNLLDEYKIGRIMLVPSLLRNILMYLQMVRKAHHKSTVQLLPNLRNWVCSGESLQKQLAEQFFDCFEEGKYALHNFYGCTEVMGDVTYFTCKSKKQLKQFQQIPIGLPIFNNVICILDQDYRPVRHGEIGQICVAGLSLANGYMNGRDPDRFIENPHGVDQKFSRLYNTGDFGSFRKGNIYFEGRTDSQIKIRGHRVDLTEVEKTILSMNFIEKAIVLCYYVAQHNQTLLSFVQLNDTSPCLTGLEIEAALKNKLQDYMIPQVMIIDKVPLLINGKLDRQALLRSYETSKKEIMNFDLSSIPENMKVIASDVFHIVGSVIGHSTRGTLTVDSNFYEMGGNSLNSITTITLLREKGYHIEISDFISAKNLGGILDKISNKLSTTEGGCRLPHLNMKAFQLSKNDKEDFIEILTDSFYEKGDLEYWIQEDLKREDIHKIYEDIWDISLNKGYSFTVRDMNTNKTIGVVVNFDAHDEPEYNISSCAECTTKIVEFVEAPFRKNGMPAGLNKVLYACLAATKISLSPQENISCIHYMEEEIIKLAKKKNFMAILSSNVNPLTQQLANNVFEYKCLVDYQINKYIHTNGTTPFALAPDSQKLMVHYKEL